LVSGVPAWQHLNNINTSIMTDFKLFAYQDWQASQLNCIFPLSGEIDMKSLSLHPGA